MVIGKRGLPHFGVWLTLARAGGTKTTGPRNQGEV